MKFYVRRVGHALYPDGDESVAALAKLPANMPLRAEVVRERSVQHNKLYWTFLARIASWLGQDDVDAEVIHEYMKIETGIVILFKTPDGEIHKFPGSTAFHAMDQTRFEEYFERAVKVAYEKLQVPPQLIGDLLDVRKPEDYGR